MHEKNNFTEVSKI